MFTNDARFLRGSGGSAMEVDQGDVEGSSATGSRQSQHVFGAF